MSIPTQRTRRTRKPAPSISGVIAEVRGRFGNDERFRAVTQHIVPGKVGPLIASFDGMQVVYQRTAKAEGDIAVVTSRKEDGSVGEAVVGEGSRVTVHEELVVKTAGVEAIFDARTISKHTIDHIGAPTTVTIEETQGCLTIKEGERTRTTRNPRRARGLAKELF